MCKTAYGERRSVECWEVHNPDARTETNNSQRYNPCADGHSDDTYFVVSRFSDEEYERCRRCGRPTQEIDWAPRQISLDLDDALVARMLEALDALRGEDND